MVYTRERSGRTRLFLDGRPDAAGKAEGELGNWDGNFRLALGDEIGGDRRTWLGSYQGASYRLTADKLIVHWGKLASSLATVEMPAAVPDSGVTCDRQPYTCYDHDYDTFFQ